MAFLIITVILLVTSSGVFTAVYPSEKMDLEDYCGRMVILPCPNSRGGAGAIRFSRMPTTACRVAVTTSSGCESYGRTLAIYFNIRYSFMPVNSKMEIYDISQSRTLKKQWTGGSSSAGQLSDPTSAGQFLSNYASAPQISIEYTPDSLYTTGYYYKVDFDYVIVEGQSSYYNTQCHALNGYVNDDFICDTTDDRVNCPAAYNYNTYSMDAARSRQHCDLGLQGGEIAGIVIGCVAFVAIVAGIVACVACAKRRPGVTEAQTVAFTNNSYAAAPSVTITAEGAVPTYPTQMYTPGNVAMYAPPSVENASLKQ